MHQNAPQDAVAQMPYIPRPDALHPTSVSQLPTDGVNERAHAPQHGTLVSCRLRRMRFTKRCLQRSAFGTQEGLQLGQPIVPIAQNYSGGPFQQERQDFSLGFIGWSQEDAGQQTRPTPLCLHSKAIKSLAICMIFAVAGLTTEAHAPGCACKPADG